MLNICYICVNSIDLLEKSNKIYISKEVVILRVVSGKARGTNLYSLEGLNTRPTLDRVKESLFNIIQKQLVDAKVLDLFAGSGALGIEAISRGAQSVVFCDKSFEAVNIIKKNIEKTHFANQAKILNKDYKNCLQTLKNEFDIIFLDPPYKADFAVEAVKEILNQNLLAEDGIIIIETDEEQRELKKLEEININVYDLRKYGRAKLIFLNRKG